MFKLADTLGADELKALGERMDVRFQQVRGEARNAA
jgi:hypothetical protein